MKNKILLSILTIGVIFFSGCDDKETKKETEQVAPIQKVEKFFTLTTGSTFGAYYREGKELGEAMSKVGHSFKIVSSDGGEQNGRRVAKEIADFGFIQKDTHNLLATMDSLYANNVNVVSKVDDEAILLIVNKNSDIKSEKDIKDNKVKIAITSKSAGAASSLDTMGKLSKSFAGKEIVYKDLNIAMYELKSKTIDVLMVVQSTKIKNDKIESLLKEDNIEIINITDNELINSKINGKKVYNECSFNNVKTICTEALLITNNQVDPNVISKVITMINK